MLQSEARKKYCPFMSGPQPDGKLLSVHCAGDECVLWEEWKVRGKGPNPEFKPHDPPQGDCGLRTSEGVCNYDL